ncbi:SIS domain-containing protein [Paenibacillus flagellatus]|uniref:Iron dicitrate transport regulator FecR n=1 Tax=Paenibacillus flagellatus TaxID=2211139 RepID=A0A2V5JYT9_9BACL|nr:SIS domain-containing protein [Paenibacillus flagellatus]PYI52055.1 iron dicitrate transport regulator FecR [Paenibacillus flagellatus]
MSSTFGQLTYPEISAQAEALAAAFKQLEAQKEWVTRFIGNPAFDEVIFIGSGSSYYQAQTMAATYKKWVGRPASAHPSSEIYLFRDAAAVPGRNYLLVGVSRSGESTEVILALESVKGVAGWTTCGITCHEDSKMAQMTECLVSPLGKEKSTVMTKSLSSMTFMMQAAAALASGKPELWAEAARVVEADADVVKAADSFAKSFVQEHDLHKFIYLGMGAYYGLSQEACLKIKEMSYVWTESFGTLEFRHGPKSIVEPGTLVCLLLSETARSYELKVAEEMKAYGATVLVVTAYKGDDTAFADAVFEVGGRELSDEARSVLYLPALQYIGFYTALKKGVDPDHPRNLTQVVKI